MEENIGQIIGINGSVITAKFDKKTPKLLNKLICDNVICEVVEELDNSQVQVIALNSTMGLISGKNIIDTGNPIKIKVGDSLLGRMLNVFSQPIDKNGEIKSNIEREIYKKPINLMDHNTNRKIYETGIKIIDLLAPLEYGGKAGLFGGAGVGKTV